MEINFIHIKKSHLNAFVKGDSKYQNIAAASILAKTYRDDYMKMIGADFPKYKQKQGISNFRSQKKQLKILVFQVITEIHLSY